MTTIKITVYAMPRTKDFAKKVISQLVTELSAANVEVVPHDIPAITEAQHPLVVALLYSDTRELKFIRNGSIRPNLSFQIKPAPSNSFNRDYSVCTLVHALHRICFELNPDRLTILRMPEGLAPKTLEYLQGQSVVIELS